MTLADGLLSDTEQLNAQLLIEIPGYVDRLRRTSTFYARRLEGIDPAEITDGDSFRSSLPLMSKQDMLADQSERPPYGTILSVDPAEVRQVHLTSGTSGFGQETYALSERDVDDIGEAWRPLFRRAGVQTGDCIVILYPVTFLAVARSLMEAGRRHGVTVLPLAGTDRGLTATVIERFQPTAIVGRAAALALIGDSMEEAGSSVADSSVRAILSAGLGEGQAAQLSERFGAVVHEYYGCSQIGTIAGGTCAGYSHSRPVIHLDHGRWIFEVLNPQTGTPVTNGEEGELVITTPRRQASPLLRFRMGDRVILRNDCGCGLGWGIEAGSIGRYDDMLKIRGNNVWPSQIDEAVLVHPRVRDYRAARTVDARGIDGLTIVVAIDGSQRDEDGTVTELMRAVKRRTNVTPHIEVVRELPDPGPKPRRWVAEDQIGALR